ncbi:hypothetical protein XF30_00675 [Bradyrhizobium sp. SUTN9-2]|nr:hypothetical protein XF30_00675 [Bradyrhizobium sp. SUTN9-2]
MCAVCMSPPPVGSEQPRFLERREAAIQSNADAGAGGSIERLQFYRARERTAFDDTLHKPDTIRHQTYR